jgi:hypothetical protein
LRIVDDICFASRVDSEYFQTIDVFSWRNSMTAKPKAKPKHKYNHHVPVKLKETDYEDAAKELGVEVAAIKAVSNVESLGSGFQADGRPKILFEAAVFSRLTAHKYDKSHPNISSKTWNRKLYKGGAEEYKRLAEAAKLDREAALRSASWGKFQIMGDNYRDLGYESAEAFVHAMCASERNQLKAFVKFIRSKGLKTALRDKNWAKFARLYNGPGYKKNRYDIHMRDAYQKAVKAQGPAMTTQSGNQSTSTPLKKSDYVISPAK